MPPRKKPAHAPTPKPEETADPSLCFIQRLPFDTLSYIFKTAEAGYRDEHGPRILTSSTHAYSFCHVNSVWRSVALNTPELWTCINVQSLKSFLRGEAWISHAARYPLDVRIMTKTPNVSREAVMAVFGPHFDHIENLAIDTTKEQSVRNKHFLWPEGTTSIVRLELTVVFDSPTHAVNIFRSCPQLQELRLAGSYLHAALPDETEVTTVRLARLKIADISENLLGLFLAPHAAFPEECEVTFNGVQMLTFRQCDFGRGASELLACLRNLPQIEGLRFERVDGSDRVFDLLCKPDSNGLFYCPRLRKLEFSECTDWTDSFMDFEPRYRGIHGKSALLPPPLESFDVYTCPYVNDHNAAKRMFRAFGTKFSFHNDTELGREWRVRWEPDVRSEDEDEDEDFTGSESNEWHSTLDRKEFDHVDPSDG